MWFFRKPSPPAIRAFLAVQSRRALTYEAVGATRLGPPPGYVVDHTRVRLGEGEALFSAAREALRRWEQFRLGWLELCWPETPIETERVVAVLAHVLGAWSLNACRIIDVIDEPGPPARFGLAYGTLPGHAQSGEERFLVEWDRRDGSVWYDVLAFSRPHERLARLGYPYVRRKQKQFGRESARAMARAVGHLGD